MILSSKKRRRGAAASVKNSELYTGSSPITAHNWAQTGDSQDSQQEACTQRIRSIRQGYSVNFALDPQVKRSTQEALWDIYRCGRGEDKGTTRVPLRV